MEKEPEPEPTPEPEPEKPVVKERVKESAKKPQPKAEEQPQHKKRGEDHEMFQGLTNLLITDQKHVDKGYKFSYYIASS